MESWILSAEAVSPAPVCRMAAPDFDEHTCAHTRAHTRAHTDTLTPARNSRRGAAIVGRRRSCYPLQVWGGITVPGEAQRPLCLMEWTPIRQRAALQVPRMMNSRGRDDAVISRGEFRRNSPQIRACACVVAHTAEAPGGYTHIPHHGDETHSDCMGTADWLRNICYCTSRTDG